VNGVGHSKNKHTRDAASSPLSEWSGAFKKQTHKRCCKFHSLKGELAASLVCLFFECPTPFT
jgi:hypothetical protein